MQVKWSESTRECPDNMNFTAANLEKMSEEELEALLESMPKFEPPTDEVLGSMDVGIYDESREKCLGYN